MKNPKSIRALFASNSVPRVTLFPADDEAGVCYAKKINMTYINQKMSNVTSAKIITLLVVVVIAFTTTVVFSAEDHLDRLGIAINEEGLQVISTLDTGGAAQSVEEIEIAVEQVKRGGVSDSGAEDTPQPEVKAKAILLIKMEDKG